MIYIDHTNYSESSILEKETMQDEKQENDACNYEDKQIFRTETGEK